VVHADLLLHVVDASDPLRDERIEQVQTVLAEIGAGAVPQLVVMNKADLLVGQEDLNCPRAMVVSAMTGQGIAELLDGIGAAIGVVAPHQVMLAPGDGKNRAWLYQSGAVLSETRLTDGSVQLTVQADDKLLGQMRQREVLIESASVRIHSEL